MTKPSVFIAMPRIGQVEPESRVAAFCTATDDNVNVTVSDRCSSLLANSFNDAWCECVNSRKYDYFVLLHADVSPSPFWLDTLVEDCKDFDVIHAVVAIKDQRGLTSTAIGSIDDEWRSVRRITIAELLELPMTFSDKDLFTDQGWCLLPNTGCMLVKLGPWVRKFPGFMIKDRIVEVEGMLCSQVIPEDWGFGRWCAQNGLRVGATRKVNVEHIGRAVYPNYEKWGLWTRDEYFFKGGV